MTPAPANKGRAPRTAPTNGSVLWACLVRCEVRFLWSLLNDCSKKSECRSAPELAAPSLLNLRVCVCVCARRAGASVAAAVLPWKRGHTSPTRSSRHNTLTSPREEGVGGFLEVQQQRLSGWERTWSAASAAGASPT